MTEQPPSVTERLCYAGNPRNRQDWARERGYYVATCRISPADIPQLIELACKWGDPDWHDPDWPDDESQLPASASEVELLPVTAWRTLADLQCTESVEPLIGMLCELDDTDDWSIDELPQVFGKIGRPAIEPLVRLVQNADERELARGIAADALHHVAKYHPETHTEVAAHLTAMMAKAAEYPMNLNSQVLSGLVELLVAGAAEPIERAFAGNRIDVGWLGDWEYVRRRLGVQGLGLEMPKHPYNGIEQFRRNMGIGIFSPECLFDVSTGELDAERAQGYCERALTLFSQSAEAEQVVERFGTLQWLDLFLDFGLQYLGEVVDSMTRASVEEFVSDYVPRKVSTEPESAALIIFELTKFWEYVQRVFDLPEARSIVQWLNTDGLVEQLEDDLTDPANFGLAKSFLMAGQAAGYDMNSEEGLNEFMAAYNQGHRMQCDGDPLTPIVSHQVRTGRNDPCPCGSGKKFKKCCLRSS